MEWFVSHLVNKDEANRTSEEDVGINTNEPDISERVWMATQILRLSTAQRVLGARALYLPNNHALLGVIGSLVAVQGRVVTLSSGPSLTTLELFIHMADEEANSLVISLMTARVDSPILEGVTGPVVLPDH